jgi:hypothetical protein
VGGRWEVVGRGGRWEVGGGWWVVSFVVVAAWSTPSPIPIFILTYKTQLLAPSPDHRGLPFELYILTDIKGYCKGRSNFGDTRMQ